MTVTDSEALRIATRKDHRKQRIAGMLAGKPTLGPGTVHFDIANACNTRCTTCWHHSPFLEAAHRPSALWKKQRLTLAAFERIFDEFVALGGLTNIILSGMGDPTLNPALYAMVERAHAHGVAVTIITNLLRADVPRLLASPG
ncbi:MAG: MoaA/NifB/PqqE/SkfB family radical SAM enzyme, partial [Myxococcota bacterium]